MNVDSTLLHLIIEMGPDLIREYFWPLGIFWPDRRWDFFDPKVKKLKYLVFLKGNFANPEVANPTWPNPSIKKIIQFNPGQFLTQTHHYT